MFFIISGTWNNERYIRNSVISGSVITGVHCSGYKGQKGTCLFQRCWSLCNCLYRIMMDGWSHSKWSPYQDSNNHVYLVWCKWPYRFQKAKGNVISCLPCGFLKSWIKTLSTSSIVSFLWWTARALDIRMRSVAWATSWPHCRQSSEAGEIVCEAN